MPRHKKIASLNNKKRVALILVLLTGIFFVLVVGFAFSSKGEAYYYCHSETKDGTRIRCITVDEDIGGCWGSAILKSSIVETGLRPDGIGGSTCEGLSLGADVYVFDKKGRYIGTQPLQ